MKVGIMGGTFNPIHYGHLMIAQKAYETVHLDQVLFIPSGKSYMKKNVPEASKRLDMVRRAVAPYPNFELSTIEADRMGNTYTYETLELLTAQNPEDCYYFILGADALFQIERWKNPELIFKHAMLICAVRDHYDISSVKKKGAELSRLGANIIYLDIPKINISSTNIRAMIKNRLSVLDFVPKEVVDYIIQEHLYEED